MRLAACEYAGAVGGWLLDLSHHLGVHAACGTSRPTLFAGADFRAAAPVGTIMPQAPSRALSSSSMASRRCGSNVPGSKSLRVFAAEKPKRP